MAYAGHNPSDAEIQRLLAPAPPRVWPVLLVTTGAVSFALFASWAVQIFGLLAPMLDAHADPGKVAAGESPGPIVRIALAVLPVQIVLLIAALGGGGDTAESRRRRLGLVRGRGPAWAVPVFMAGAVFVMMSLSAVGRAVFQHPSDASRAITRTIEATGDPLSMLALVLMIGVGPAIAEELLFRGYAQRALVARWGPAAGIGATSVLFAAAHLDPQVIVPILAGGVFIGVVGWCTGSLWPCIACHFTSNVGALGLTWLAGGGQPGPGAAVITLWIGSGVAFAASVALLIQMRPREEGSPAILPP